MNEEQFLKDLQNFWDEFIIFKTFGKDFKSEYRYFNVVLDEMLGIQTIYIYQKNQSFMNYNFPVDKISKILGTDEIYYRGSYFRFVINDIDFKVLSRKYKLKLLENEI